MKQANTLVLLLCLITSFASAESSRPNIIFFLIDDIGTHQLGCYGKEEIPTPNIDALARNGIRFNTAWACPSCVPTRTLLMSGQYRFKTGDNLPGTIEPLFHALRQAGYATFMGGKWHLKGLPGDKEWGFGEHCLYASLCDAAKSNKEWVARFKGPWWGKQYGGTPPGFPSFEWHPMIIRNGEFMETGPSDFGPDILSRDVVDFIRRKASGQAPFFIYYAEGLVHEPNSPMPDPASPTGKTERGLAAGVRYLDKVIGQLVAALKEAGAWDNTVLMIGGDNPIPSMGKGMPSAIGVHVPLIVAGGKKWVTWQGETGCLTDFSDIYPTCLALAGVDGNSHSDLSGKSFKPLLDGDKSYSRPWILCYGARTIRDRQWCLDGFGQLWRCNESGSPFTFELITKDKENAETAGGRAALEAVLAGLPAIKSNTGKGDTDDKKEAQRMRMLQLYEKYKGLGLRQQ
jgi:arylsulfatase A